MHVNRREFLRKSICAALGGASLYSAIGSLRLIGAAAAAQRGFSDYKALVCVFMYGGNDSFNTVVPYDSAHYAAYAGSRQALALAQGDVAANALNAAAADGGPGGPPSDGGSYGLHPAMPELAGLFNSGKAAIVANVGSLLYPTSQSDYQNGTVPTPAQLFSHDDQTNQWMTSRADDANANGWGGRIADLLYSSNAGQVPMSITLSGQNRFQRGGVVNQFSVDSWGASCAATGDPDCGPFSVTTMSYLGNGPESWMLDPWQDQNVFDDDAAAYNALIQGGTQTHVLERAFADSATRTIANSTLINTALTGVTLATAFPDTDLGNQLAAVAMLIKVRQALGMSRQIYFVAVGNYDTHGTQLVDQNDNLTELSQGLSAFYNATVELGIADGVTAFTASDFGRSLAVNADGTDHGWGGHHFVVGGAVHGQRFYGTMPSLAQYDDDNPDSNPDDTGYGQIIPKQAVDQYAATLASWFGVDASSVNDIFPNLGRFPSSDLGFMT